MKTDKPKEYIAPEVKVVEVIVEKGFAITGIIYNNRFIFFIYRREFFVFKML